MTQSEIRLDKPPTEAQKPGKLRLRKGGEFAAGISLVATMGRWLYWFMASKLDLGTCSLEGTSVDFTFKNEEGLEAMLGANPRGTFAKQLAISKNIPITICVARAAM